MANRFGRFWAKGKLLIDGVRVMQQRGVFALLRRYAIPVGVIEGSCSSWPALSYGL
jgi:hypothetical protein